MRHTGRLDVTLTFDRVTQHNVL